MSNNRTTCPTCGERYDCAKQGKTRRAKNYCSEACADAGDDNTQNKPNEMKKAIELSNSELNAMIAKDQGWGCLNVDWIPDYANDLNAIHEAVMTLGRKTPEYAEYCSHVNHIIAMELNTSCELLIQSITANARQRSEAYVITKGLAL